MVQTESSDDMLACVEVYDSFVEVESDLYEARNFKKRCKFLLLQIISDHHLVASALVRSYVTRFSTMAKFLKLQYH